MTPKEKLLIDALKDLTRKVHFTLQKSDKRMHDFFGGKREKSLQDEFDDLNGSLVGSLHVLSVCEDGERNE